MRRMFVGSMDRDRFACSAEIAVQNVVPDIFPPILSRNSLYRTACARYPIPNAWASISTERGVR